MNRFLSLVLAAACCSAALAFRVTLVHTNDVHSRVEPATVNKKPYGGYSRVSTLFQQIRERDKRAVFLNAGDTFQGTLYYNVYKGAADGHLMNLLRYQAMALGNHEFDDGPMGLLPFAKAVQFPLLCANLDFAGEPELAQYVKPHTTLTIGRDRIGLIGLMTPDLPTIAAPGPNIKLLDLDRSLRRSIDSLAREGVRQIVVLSHCGYEMDLEIAKRHPDIDVILGGHSHSYLGPKIEGFPEPMGPYPTRVGKVLVAQAWEWGKVVGVLSVEFNRDGEVSKVHRAEPIPVDESIRPDPLIESAIVAFQRPILALQTQVVGEASAEIPRGEGDESPMGNLIADAMLAATEKQGTVMALMNRGGVRGGLDAGPITYGEAISVQPFNNTLVVLDLSGAEIIAALENGAARDRVTQVSKGLEVEFDFRKAAGSRVVSVRFRGQALESNKTYRVVVNNFMAKGGDDYTALRDSKGYRYDTGFLDIDALVAYLKAVGKVSAMVEGRVKVSRP